MEPSVFEQAADALWTLLPDDLGAAQQRSHRWGMKLWFGDTGPPAREHYEAQVVGAKHVPGATALAIEVGFHAEHSKAPANEAVAERLAAVERRWRKVLGVEPVLGPFLGRDSWRRLSETWLDPDLGEPDLPMEIATRLLDYVTVLEPVLRRPR